MVSSGSSSVSAPWVAETTACSSRLSCGQLEDPEAGAADRGDQVVGMRVEAGVDHGQERGQLASTISSASAGLEPISL